MTDVTGSGPMRFGRPVSEVLAMTPEERLAFERGVSMTGGQYQETVELGPTGTIMRTIGPRISTTPGTVFQPASGGGGATATQPATGGMSGSQQQSARAIIEEALRSYDLYSPEMVDTIMGLVTGTDEIVPALVRSTIRGTTQYQTRFRGLAERQRRGLSAISEAEYLALERDYQNIMRTAGLPTGFYDSPDDFVNFIGADISAAELSTRINDGYRAVRESDPTVLQTMRQFYGLTDGEIAAYFLDPDRAVSLIEQQVATAQLGAAAARQGFENVVERTAFERMQRAGVEVGQAEQAFGTLAAGRELLTPLERGEQALDVTETAMGLVGQSPEALQRLRTQQRRRVARFEGGGQFATQGAEVTGLQTA
jgi:hypothetical protein